MAKQSVRSGGEVPLMGRVTGDKIMKGHIGHWEDGPCTLKNREPLESFEQRSDVM